MRLPRSVDVQDLVHAGMWGLIQALDQFEHLVLIDRVAEPDAQPFGLGLAALLIVTNYTEFAGQS